MKRVPDSNGVNNFQCKHLQSSFWLY